MFKKLRKSKYNGGMTLVELMVVLGIFLLVTGITIFDYNSFRSNISLQNLADEVALSVRKAQSYAIGARSASSGAFSDSFGVSFSTSSEFEENIPNIKSFVIFADLNEDGEYNSSEYCGVADSECLEVLTIRTEDVINNISGEYIDDDVNSLDIIFTRPNPDANFYQEGYQKETQFVSVEIKNTRTEKLKNIIISNTGQISIE